MPCPTCQGILCAVLHIRGNSWNARSYLGEDSWLPGRAALEVVVGLQTELRTDSEDESIVGGEHVVPGEHRSVDTPTECTCSCVSYRCVAVDHLRGPSMLLPELGEEADVDGDVPLDELASQQ